MRHQKGVDTKCVTNCTDCRKQQLHDDLRAEARAAYQSDGERIQPNFIVSVDLQKVIMLPMLPGVKKYLLHKAFLYDICTSQRIQKSRVQLAVWHEAVGGRKAEEISSAWVAALKKTDFKNIIYDADNCTTQNKNWTLISTLVLLTRLLGLQKQTGEVS